MVNRKIDDAQVFAYYVSMGDRRSMRKTARHFHVSLHAIERCALRNNWTARLVEIEKEAKKRADEMLAETRAEVRARHLKLLRAISSRGVQALQERSLDSAYEGVKSIETAIKLERTIMGEPSEYVGHSVQEVTRREMETFLRRDDEPDHLDDDGDDLDGAWEGDTDDGDDT